MKLVSIIICSFTVTVKPPYLSTISPPKDDILYHEQQLLAHEPVITKEIKQLQEQKELEEQYLQIASKLTLDQQAILQLHTGIQPTTDMSLQTAGGYPYANDPYGGTGVTSLTGAQGYPNPTGCSGSGYMGGLTTRTGGNRMYPGTAYPKSAMLGGNPTYGSYGTDPYQGSGQNYQSYSNPSCDGQQYSQGVSEMPQDVNTINPQIFDNPKNYIA